MDKIYAGAEVTIIAAAGSGPSHGLPGISSRRSYNQLEMDFADTTFVSLPRRVDSIAESTW
jgi:hypothetical protein